MDRRRIDSTPGSSPLPSGARENSNLSSAFSGLRHRHAPDGARQFMNHGFRFGSGGSGSTGSQGREAAPLYFRARRRGNPPASGNARLPFARIRPRSFAGRPRSPALSRPGLVGNGHPTQTGSILRQPGRSPDRSPGRVRRPPFVRAPSPGVRGVPEYLRACGDLELPSRNATSPSRGNGRAFASARRHSDTRRTRAPRPPPRSSTVASSSGAIAWTAPRGYKPASLGPGSPLRGS